MIHLTPRLLEDLLAGAVPPPDARALLDHLDGDCAACGRVLAGGPDLETLARLLAAAEAGPVAPPDPGALWAGVTARLPGTRRRWGSWPLWATVLAAAVALLVLRPQPFDQVKGTGQEAPVVRLRVAVGAPGPDGLVLGGQVEDGDGVPPDATLIFDLDVDRSAARYLFVIDGDGRAWPLAPLAGTPAEPEPAGSRRVRQGDRWVALDVADMTGPLVVVGAASSRSRDLVTGIIDPHVAGRAPAGVSTDVLRVFLTR